MFTTYATLNHRRVHLLLCSPWCPCLLSSHSNKDVDGEKNLGSSVIERIGVRGVALLAMHFVTQISPPLEYYKLSGARPVSLPTLIYFGVIITLLDSHWGKMFFFKSYSKWLQMCRTLSCSVDDPAYATGSKKDHWLTLVAFKRSHKVTVEEHWRRTKWKHRSPAVGPGKEVGERVVSWRKDGEAGAWGNVPNLPLFFLRRGKGGSIQVSINLG